MKPDQHSKKRMLEDALDFVLKSRQRKIREDKFDAWRYGSYLPRDPFGPERKLEPTLEEQTKQEQVYIDLLVAFKDKLFAGDDVDRYL